MAKQKKLKTKGMGKKTGGKVGGAKGDGIAKAKGERKPKPGK